MQYLDIFGDMLQKLNLSFDERKTTLNIFSVVLQTFNRLSPTPLEVRNDDCVEVRQNRGSISATDRIEVCRRNLQVIIDLTSSYDAACVEFKAKFPRWKYSREKNIELLNGIAKSLGEDRTICNIVNITSFSVAAVGGVAIIAALLCPPTALLLPVWLGGVAVASPLAVAGSVAAGAGGVASLATSVAEFALAVKHMDEAKKVCKRDKSDFKTLEKWLKHSEDLKKAMAALIDFGVLEHISKQLNDLVKKRHKLSSDSSEFILVIKKCAFSACTRDKHLLLDFGITAAAAILTTLMAMILFHRQTNFVLQAAKLGLGAVSGIEAGIEITKLIAATGGKGAAAAKLIPGTLAKKVAFGALAGVGIAIDVTMVVLNSIELVKGETCEEGKMIIAVAKMLEDERKVLDDVYKRLD